MSDPVYLVHQCAISGEPILLAHGVSCPWCRGTAIVKLVGEMVYVESLMERAEREGVGRWLR